MTPNIFAITVCSQSLDKCAEIAAAQHDTIPCPPPCGDTLDEIEAEIRALLYSGPTTEPDLSETMRSERTTALLPGPMSRVA